MGKKQLVAIAAALLVGGGLAIPAAIYGPQLMGFQESPADAPQNPDAPAAADGAAANLTEFRSEEHGIAFDYPENWAKLQHPEPEVLLVASEGPLATVQLRAVDIQVPIGKEQLPQARELTDHIVGANESAQLRVEPTPIERGGMPGYWYLYTFKDETGAEGAHSHFFLFKENMMFSLVFETIPADQFHVSAQKFDQVVDSIRVL